MRTAFGDVVSGQLCAKVRIFGGVVQLARWGVEAQIAPLSRMAPIWSQSYPNSSRSTSVS